MAVSYGIISDVKTFWNKHSTNMHILLHLNAVEFPISKTTSTMILKTDCEKVME